MLITSPSRVGQTSPPAAAAEKVVPEKVIIDTDIGDDIDDAFAVAPALRSPELQILGVTTTFGDTETRAKLLDRFLSEGGAPISPWPLACPLRPRPRLRSAATPKAVTSQNRLIQTLSLFFWT